MTAHISSRSLTQIGLQIPRWRSKWGRARVWLYLKRLYFISSVIAYYISPYASLYAALSYIFFPTATTHHNIIKEKFFLLWRHEADSHFFVRCMRSICEAKLRNNIFRASATRVEENRLGNTVVNHPWPVQQTQTGRSVETLLAGSRTIPVCEKGCNSKFLLGFSVWFGQTPPIHHLQFVTSWSSL